MSKHALKSLKETIIACECCPRLVAWRQQVAREKRAAFRDQNYWGKPVPGFGDPAAKLLIVGLAPAAHGGNRTGRIFTGDRSGDWLYAALFRAGFANQPNSTHAGDGLKLKGVYVTACVRCAPPANKPTPDERDKCRGYLVEELRLLRKVQVIVCLGGYAWDGALRALRELESAKIRCPSSVVRGDEQRTTDNGPPSKRPLPKFGHGVVATFGPYTLLGCYHPSQQNTFTGRLTEKMLDEIFVNAKRLLR